MSNISTFLSEFKNEFARPCNFEVNIKRFPPALQFLSVDSRKLSFRCEAAELPTRTFALTQQKIYGPVTYHPVQNAYDKINLTFICSDSMEEKEFFDAWMNYISPNTNSISTNINIDSFMPNLLFDFEYYDEYTSTIEIIQKSLDIKDSYNVTLYEAYPISVNAMPLSWENTNAIHKLTVNFVYRYFREDSTYKQTRIGGFNF